MAGKRRVFSLPVSVREVRSVPPTNEITRTTEAATPSTEPTGIPISSLPVADTPGNSDVVPGVQSGTTKKYSLANLFSWILGQITPAGIGAVPTSRTVNGKALLQDISLGAADVGARADTWMPSASDVGAQPTITANGILKGDGAGGVSAAVAGTDYQAPLTIDATPTASSTNPVQSGGVYTDVRTRVPVYGKGVNLLRNWYFVGGGTGRGVFPVNQRGQSSYDGFVYSIDNWQLENRYGQAITINSDGIQIIGTSSAYQGIQQYIDPSLFNGQKATISALCTDGTLATASGIITITSSDRLILNSGGDLSVFLYGSTSLLGFHIRCLVGITKTIVAAKLELGTEQTLCHNEGTAENPVWVLNEIPDYEYELYRCMTSTADSTDTYANKSLATEQQLAYVETGTTASRNYAVGEYFCWNGLLYRVKTAISSGASFTPGTNCEQTMLSNMAEYWLDVTSQFSTVSGATLKVLVNPTIRKVKLFFLVDGLSNGSSVVTIPTQYAPDTAKLVYVSSTDSYRIGIFHGRFTQTPSSFGNIYEFHSFLRYYSGNRQIAAYYPLANPAYAVTFDIEYVY